MACFIPGKSVPLQSQPADQSGVQEEPYKFTTISKDLQPVAILEGDFLVHEGQVTFITNDRLGEMRMVDFDPAGEHWTHTHLGWRTNGHDLGRSRFVEWREIDYQNGISYGDDYHDFEVHCEAADSGRGICTSNTNHLR
jgi:hypothetical protein